MSKVKDETGNTYGQWTVLERAENNKHGKAQWLCKCSCCKKVVVAGNSLRMGQSTSCVYCSQKHQKGENHPMFGRHHTKEVLRKMSEIKKGKVHSEETKAKMSKTHSGKPIHSEEEKVKRSVRMRGINNPMFGKCGENHPNWNPNLTDEERLIERNYSAYYDWRTAVYVRDGYTCQCCGDNKGSNLNAHHLESYTDNKELRIELDNGITLCKECHLDFHHLYGYGGNTKAQYKEYNNG